MLPLPTTSNKFFQLFPLQEINSTLRQFGEFNFFRRQCRIILSNQIFQKSPQRNYMIMLSLDG